MKAIVFTQYGRPDLLELKEVPKPEPGANELLVKIHASSINSWDWEYLMGTPFANRLMFGLFKPKPGKQCLGADIAGIIEAVGTDVTRFRPGEEVFGDLWDKWGGFAEYACIDENSVEKKPADLSFEEAAAIPQAGVLALQALRRGKPLAPGQAVLINGAGGGVGTFAIQLSKLAGAEVTGVDAAYKLDTVRAVGADHVIDYVQQDFVETGKSYDLIVDCQARWPLSAIKRALKPGGTYAVIGGQMKRILQVLMHSAAERITRADRKLRLVAEGPNKGLADLRALLEAGKLVPVIDKTFQLDEVPKALQYFGDGIHKGKIAISVTGMSVRSSPR